MGNKALYTMLVLLIMLFWTVDGIGQEKKFISGDFSGFTFKKLVLIVETQTGCYFYYNPAELDSLPVNIIAQQLLLQDLLAKVLTPAGFKYAIDSLNRVFITKRMIIQTQLAPGFFTRNNERKDESPEAVDQLSDNGVKKEKVKSTPGNKLYEIGVKSERSTVGNAVITGYVRDVKNGEVIIGASVYIDTPYIGVVTDQQGYYSIALSKGRHTLYISSAGMKDAKRQILLNSNGKLDVEMETYVANLKTVLVVAEKKSNIKSTQMGVERISIKTIKQIPAVLGEADVLRAVLTLPGVTSVGEASTGFNVRGGSADQNLILFSDATIYNPSHLFGFFSAFNADIVKGVELYKSAIPEKFGGRLSSVLDIAAREGNKKKWSVSGGIGPLTSKVTLEGPLVKEKSSFILSSRTTYSNWLLRSLRNSAYSNSRASFYDANLNINHTINAKNQLYITGYWSDDQFRLNGDTLFKYGNRNANIKWKHIFNSNLYGLFTAGIDNYQYSISANENPVNAFKINFGIKQTHGRFDFTWSPNNQHTINVGINSVYYQLNPGNIRPNSSQSLVSRDEVQAEQALETGIYIGDRFNITPKFSVNAGIRYVVFNAMGSRTIYKYIPGLPKDVNSISDSVKYGPGKIINTYQAPEYRLAIRYMVSDNASLKLSFNTLRQYIHLLSNTTSISPIDTWKLSDPSIKPQSGNQVSLGYYQNFKSNTIETSVEVYYKSLKNFLDFKSGANLLLNKKTETAVISTKGKAYGAEFLIKKTSGKLNGWFSYTYSRILLQMNDPIAGELINNGNYYPANYDKPHTVNFIGNYRFTHRFSASLNIVYSTGRPITLPIALFNQGGAQRVLYSDRNQYRIPDYFRTDISMTIEGNHKLKQMVHNSWSFGVYNLLARQNPYSVYFAQENGVIKGYQLSIFGTFIPFITYNFKF
jgi:CarboxypepD_reg-like domain/TonB-dependent Receptor Plug Domain